MRRPAAVLSAVLVLGGLQASAGSAPAAAAPAPALCALDVARGAVPAGFVLEACTDPGAVTVRNDRALPLVVRTTGDLGAPLPVHADGSPTADVLRAIVAPDDLLMPGDVVRWPLGPGPADLSVGLLPAGAEHAIAASLGRLLPEPADEDAGTSVEAFAAVVGEIAPAVAERADCVAGKNFLRAAACDVLMSTVIGNAAFTHLPPSAARHVYAVLDAPLLWAEWQAAAAAGARSLDGGELRLSQTAVPPLPPPPTSPPPGPPPAAAARPAPAPPYARAPAPLPAPAAPAPAPVAPAPAPRPAPVPPPAPAPVVVPPPPVVERTDVRERFEQWLRDLAEQARERHDEHRDDDGRGRDDEGRGRDHDRRGRGD